jgi:hypothetical protein
MNIYHQIGQWWDNLLERYQIKKSIQKITINDSLEHMLFEKRDDNESVFLIDESYFNLIRCPIEGIIYESLKIEQLNQLIETKIKEIKKTHNITWYMLMYDIENIIIDGESSQYLLWKTGKMQRDIFFIFIKPSLAITCPTLLKDIDWPLVYPSSYFTVQFMVKSLAISSFLIITFDENTVKLISIKDGFYHQIQNLDRGINNLKQILISNNVIQHFNKSDNEIDQNPMAKTVLIESINFYNKIIIDWIQEHNDDIKTCVINIPTLKNHLFINQLIESYSNTIWWYIISTSTIDKNLKQYEKKRQMNELDILTYLNFAETKELI